MDMESKSKNRRISHARMTRQTFQRLEGIVSELTPERLQDAEEELKTSSHVTDPDIDFLLRELRYYGVAHPLSNENRLNARLKIKSICWKYGLPNVWFTINPNDLTNPAKLRLCMNRFYSAEAAIEKIDQFRKSIDFIHDSVQDPVSSAQFFHREINSFFKNYVRVGERGVFGKISTCYALMETNERGALHIHGFMWLAGNIHMPKLAEEMIRPGNETFKENVLRWVDEVFCEVSLLKEKEKEKRF
jgi:hypothetical protein